VQFKVIDDTSSCTGKLVMRNSRADRIKCTGLSKASVYRALGHVFIEALAVREPMSASNPTADFVSRLHFVCFVPCVDGSELAR